ncbi:sugar ABC transporter ATP-binding protein [Microvirga sp. M2]|uniref:sugar ABC transporter ATP-binding protein n=1 Tax=Microvirga sp. M2 TaxID=3073270 RepID=UPI0039C16D41
MSSVLEVHSVEKTFDRTRALRGAEFSLISGEIHGLLGANGAGKSTLSKVISGHIRPDSGQISWRGALLKHTSPREALDAGIAMVMQETSLAPHLSVLENIFLPELGRPGPLSFRRMRHRAREVLTSLGVADTLPLERDVESLSVAQRQLVEIAKALALNADLIIFDEPTTSLSPLEVERLFDIMTKLRDQGRALVFVSHRLEEVFAITDRVTVMREGRTISKGIPTTSLTQTELIRLMVGQELGAVYEAKTPATIVGQDPVLAVRNLASSPHVRNVSFAVHPGEVLGLGGLVGAGRSETLEAIFGLRPRQGGELVLDGQRFDPRRPSDAVRAGVGFVAEDRRVQGIVPDFSVKENLLLGHLGAHRGFGLGYGARSKEIDALLRRLDLPGERLLDANMLAFSGGMQQKIIIGRWLLLRPKLLLLDEPTKGVDIGTRASIYAILREIAADGVGIVVVSSDFDELLGLCSRIVVMSDGTSRVTLPSEILDEEKLTLLTAPRTSMERMGQMLRELAHEVGGAGFWALLDGDRICCLDAVVAHPNADPGFRAGGMPLIPDCPVRTALVRPSGDFVKEPDGSRQTLVVPVRSQRGHDMGLIGVTLDGRAPTPDAEAIRSRVQAVFASQT